ncbi:MAG: phosphotransferase [Actinomycetota bacterium]
MFSRVLRVQLSTASTAAGARPPSSVVVKLPLDGANGDAARASGAYRREALAYTDVLPHSPIRHPVAHLVHLETDGGVSIVMEDLSSHRMSDQMDGMAAADAVAVAIGLRRFHDAWTGAPALDGLAVRRATPSTFAPEALDNGLDVLRRRWAADLDEHIITAFDTLVTRRATLVDRFGAAPRPTLVHGDPRADNLAFAPDGAPVLFDWQQLAVQLGEADVAWLAATSLRVEDRRSIDRELVAAYGGGIDRYRLGLALPGLAVLLLAQREVADDRTARFITTSLQRIGAALVDLDVAALGR